MARFLVYLAVISIIQIRKSRGCFFMFVHLFVFLVLVFCVCVVFLLLLFGFFVVWGVFWGGGGLAAAVVVC